MRIIGLLNCKYFSQIFLIKLKLKRPNLLHSYGPNCGFCKGIEPIWEELGKVTEEEGYDWRVGAFNVHTPEHQGKLEFRSVFPGPLPGLHL